VICQLIQVALLLTDATYSTVWALRNLEGRDVAGYSETFEITNEFIRIKS
jgi:hypothetical protein